MRWRKYLQRVGIFCETKPISPCGVINSKQFGTARLWLASLEGEPTLRPAIQRFGVGTAEFQTYHAQFDELSRRALSRTGAWYLRRREALD